MSDNRIFSPDACTVCGRLGDPHADWCADVTERLRAESLAFEAVLQSVRIDDEEAGR